jgi:glycosyltransferase involved in cell wall biosynthesis
LVRRERIDLIHTHQSRAHFFGVLLRWMTKTPCVATAHARHVQPHWLFNDFVIANSEATFQFQRRWNLVPQDRMQVVHYLLNSSCLDEVPPTAGRRLREHWQVDNQTLVAGIVGDLIPRKGQIHAVRAWPIVRQRLPNSKLVFVGIEKDPRYAQLVRSEINRLGIASDVIWAGYRTDIAAVMQALDVCVSAALEEALGLTIPEAMAAGRAVVATKVGGVPENIADGMTGILVPPADPAALADALVRILSDDSWREACGQRAWHQVREKYDAPRQLDQLEDIYRRVTSNGRGSWNNVGSVEMEQVKSLIEA